MKAVWLCRKQRENLKSLRISILCSFVGVIAAPAVLVLPAAAVAAEAAVNTPVPVNLIRNPGFEELDSEGNPSGWTFSPGMILDRNVVRSGRHSIHGGGLIDGEGNPRISRVAQTVEVEPDTGYRLSVWAIRPSSGFTRLMVHDGERWIARTDNSGAGLPARSRMLEWTEIVLEFDSGDTDRIQVWCGPLGNPQFWLDDFSLVRDDSIRLGDITPEDSMPKISQADRQRGYIAFERDFMERTYKTSRPQPGQSLREISIKLTPGEYKPLNIAVYALKDLAELMLAPAGDFVGPDGRHLQEKKIMVKTAVMRKDYHSTVQWSTYPLFLPRAEPDDLSENTTRLFWITVQAPEDAASGVYEGALRISARNASDLEIPLSIEVLPFRLLAPPVSYGMWHAGLAGDRYVEEHHQRMYYEDMKAHGMTTVGTYNHPSLRRERVLVGLKKALPWDEDMRMLKDAGLPAADMPLVYVSSFSWGGGGAESYGMMKRNVRSGFPELLFYVSDEPSTAPRIRSAKALLSGYTHPDTRTVTANVPVEELGRLYDVWIQTERTLPVDGEAFSRADEWGKELWAYNCQLSGTLVPTERYLTGLYAWKLGLRGMWQWAYFHGGAAYICPEGAWVGVDDHGGAYVAISPEGPIPTVGWEGKREGIDDYRYLYTLEIMSKKAAVSADETVRKLGEKGMELLAGIRQRVNPSNYYEDYPTAALPLRISFIPQPELDSEFYNGMRSSVAGHILDLYNHGIRVPEESRASEGSRQSGKTTPSGRALHGALAAGDVQSAIRLIKAGAEVNERDKEWFWTPLHRAVKLGDTAIVELLIEHGADIDAQDPHGWSALHVAADLGRSESVRRLLTAGADADLRENKGRTPLMHAAYIHYFSGKISAGKIEAAELLIRSGSDVNASDGRGHSVLHWAAFAGHADMVRYLMHEGAATDSADNHLMTPLHYTGKNMHHLRQPATAGALLEAGANPNLQDRHGWTPLHWAVLMGDPGEPHEGFSPRGISVAEKLVAHGADVNSADADSLTPLHWTARMAGDHSQTAGLLITHGAELDMKDSGGNTPLHLAVNNGHQNLTCMLLKHGGDMNAKNNTGQTPLHVAAVRGEDAVAGMLLASGACKYLRDNEGRTPLEASRIEGDYERARSRVLIREMLRD